MEPKLKWKKLNWLLGKKSKLSIENKLLIYNHILKPICTYGPQLCTSEKNITIIQRLQNKVLRIIVNASWYIHKLKKNFC